MGETAERAGRLGEAREQYEKAVALVPEEALPHFLLGQRLFAETHLHVPAAAPDAAAPAMPGEPAVVPRPAGPPSTGSRAEAELARTTELAPGFGEAWAVLGVIRLALNLFSPAPAIAALETAHRLLPHRTKVMLSLALSYAWAGRRPQAEALIEQARAARASAKDLEFARDGLLRIDAGNAYKLADHGKLEEAMPILERVAAETHEEGFRTEVTADLAHMRQELPHQRFATAYNAVAELANRGENAAAIERLEALLAATPEAPNAANAADVALARQLLEKLKARLKHPPP